MSSTSTSEQSNNQIDREQILSILGKRITEINEHLESSCSTDEMSRKEEIRWTRTLGYLADQYRKLKNDIDLDKMEAEIDSLSDIITNDETKN